jgi:hypothetical protein
MAALALSLGVMTALWYSRGRALDATDALARERAAKIATLDAEIARRSEADLARLAASGEFRVKIEAVENRTTILLRTIDRFVYRDAQCLTPEGVAAVNEGRLQ